MATKNLQKCVKESKPVPPSLAAMKSVKPPGDTELCVCGYLEKMGVTPCGNQQACMCHVPGSKKPFRTFDTLAKQYKTMCLKNNHRLLLSTLMTEKDFVHSDLCFWCSWVAQVVADKGDFMAFKFIEERYDQEVYNGWGHTNLVKAAVGGPSLQCVEFVLSSESKVDHNHLLSTSEYAAYAIKNHDKVEIVKFLLGHDSENPGKSMLISEAILYGRPNILLYLTQSGADSLILYERCKEALLIINSLVNKLNEPIHGIRGKGVMQCFNYLIGLHFDQMTGRREGPQMYKPLTGTNRYWLLREAIYYKLWDVLGLILTSMIHKSLVPSIDCINLIMDVMVTKTAPKQLVEQLVLYLPWDAKNQEFKDQLLRHRIDAKAFLIKKNDLDVEQLIDQNMKSIGEKLEATGESIILENELAPEPEIVKIPYHELKEITA